MKLKNILKNVFVILSYVRFSPTLILLYFSRNRKIVVEDSKYWCRLYSIKYVKWGGYSIVWLLSYYKEFRNLLLYRVKIARIFKFIINPESTLYINSAEIGKGLFIQHGFSTIISAKKIGDYCWINQQVTIGYTNKTDAPIIGNNVRIHAGAIVVGGVNIGDNVIIGAGTTVVKNIPSNSTVVGAPSRIMNKPK